MSYANKRNLYYSLAGIAYFLAPHIKISDAHLFLLSFDKKEFHILGNIFSMQQMIVLPFFFMLLFVGIFFITSSFGRFWCGFLCPQTFFRTVFRDLIETKLLGLRKSVDDKQKPIKDNFFLKIVSYIIIFIFFLVGAFNFTMFFVEPETAFANIVNFNDHILYLSIIFALTIFLFVDIVIYQEKFCIYSCPYARIQSTLIDKYSFSPIYTEKRGGKIYNENGDKALKHEGECVKCLKCVKVCPMHIDIRKGYQLECIHCLECIDACTTTLGERKLINWINQDVYEQEPFVKYDKSNKASIKIQKPKFLRLKSIAYMLFIAILFTAFVVADSNKKDVLINLNRTSQMFYLTADKKVENPYLVMLENKTKEIHYYTIKVEGLNDLSILRPTRDIKVSPDSKKRVVLVLKYLSSLESIKAIGKNGVVNIKINFIAKNSDEKTKQSLNSSIKTVFAYPTK